MVSMHYDDDDCNGENDAVMVIFECEVVCVVQAVTSCGSARHLCFGYFVAVSTYRMVMVVMME